MPDDLKGGKERMVFCNIEAIYEWHREYVVVFKSVQRSQHFSLHSFFLKSLYTCIENPSELAPVVKKSERKLHMYVVYCQNKPVSEHIVTEHVGYFDEIRQKLKHKLLVSFRKLDSIRRQLHLNEFSWQLCDLLIKPVQRIMKYELLIKDILKHTKRAGLIEEANALAISLDLLKVKVDKLVRQTW